MNIFFYSNIKVEDLSDGISKKVFAQINSLRRSGHKVYYTGYTSEGVAIFDNSDNVVYKEKYSSKNSKIVRVYRRWDLIGAATKFIQKSNVEFECAYLRFHLFDRAYNRLLKTLKNEGAKVIVEAHGFPYRSFSLNPSLPFHLMDVIFEPFARKYIDLVAGISNYDNIWKCKTVHIDNSIDLDTVSLQVKKEASDAKIRLISVSNEKEYHGYEKLVRGLAKYYETGGKKNIQIILVGEFRNSTMQLVDKLGMKEHFSFLGKKSGTELDEIYSKADLGIGALGMHRGSEYGSSIKTKEYFALGLPFINGWREYSYDDDYPYVKRFDLKLDYIDFFEVVSFYDKIKNNPQMQIEMREFAKANYSWDIQFKKIFENL